MQATRQVSPTVEFGRSGESMTKVLLEHGHTVGAITLFFGLVVLGTSGIALFLKSDTVAVVTRTCPEDDGTCSSSAPWALSFPQLSPRSSSSSVPAIPAEPTNAACATQAQVGARWLYRHVGFATEYLNVCPVFPTRSAEPGVQLAGVASCVRQCVSSQSLTLESSSFPL